MPKRNGYLDNFIPHLYQRSSIDLMAFTFIEAYRFTTPSVTIKEAALAFVAFFEIDEDYIKIETILVTHSRILSEYYDSKKTKITEKK